jgi:hypothetical protein
MGRKLNKSLVNKFEEA